MDPKSLKGELSKTDQGANYSNKHKQTEEGVFNLTSHHPSQVHDMTHGNSFMESMNYTQSIALENINEHVNEHLTDDNLQKGVPRNVV